MVKNFKIYKNFSLSKKDKGAIILIGNFDGLHRGHQKLFNKARNFKKKFKLKIGVITFDPIPKMFFKKLRNYRLSSFDQKIQLLKKNNVDFVKFQTYEKNSMTINSKQAIFRINEGIWKNMNLWKLYEKAQTPYSWQQPVQFFPHGLVTDTPIAM